MGRLGFCARIFRNVCTFLITCKIELRGRSNLPPDRRLGQRSGGVVCPPPDRCPSLPVRYLLVIRLLSGLASTRCRSPSYRVACPLGMVQVVLAVVRLSARSRIRPVPRRSFPAASLLSTPRCLATRSTGAFSCRRSRCLGRRLLPPSVVLVGRGSWARGVPRG